MKFNKFYSLLSLKNLKVIPNNIENKIESRKMQPQRYGVHGGTAHGESLKNIFAAMVYKKGTCRKGFPPWAVTPCTPFRRGCLSLS
jgi:hypothetical protein